MARQKAKKAECTSGSDLNSEVDTKRKRTKNRLYLQSDDNSAPTKQKQMKEDEVVQNNIGIADISQSSSEESVESDSVLPKHPQMTESNIKTNLNINASGSKKTTEIPNTRELLNNNHVRNDDAYLSNARQSSTPDNSDNAKYFKEIIRQQSFFKTQLWQMADDLREVKTIITGNLRQNLDGNNKQQDTIYSSFDLPLKTVEDIEEAVEQFLQNENNFERSCTEACKIGGTCSYNFMKRNLDRLVSNKLAQQYSWLGAKLKRKFCNLRIAEMLLTAGAAYSNAYTKLELEKAIQKWLKRAKERYDAEVKKIEARENAENRIP